MSSSSITRRGESAFQTDIDEFTSDSTEVFHLMVENAQEGIVLSQGGALLYVNPWVETFLGYSTGEIRSKPFTDFIHVEEREMVVSLYEAKLRGEVVPYGTKYRIIVAGGESKWVQSRSSLIALDGKPAIVTFITDYTETKLARDALENARSDLEMVVKERTEELRKTNTVLRQEIAERRTAQKSLMEKEERYRTLVENIPDIVYSTDGEGNIVTINHPAEEFYGYSAEELIGKSFLDFLYPEDRETVINQFVEALATRCRMTKGLRARIVARDSTIRWIETNLRRQFDEKGEYLRTDGVIRDISETKLLQERLTRSERMAATGQLAASVAHEINSPLQGIAALLSIMKKRYAHDSETEANLELLNDAFTSIRDTVRNLLDLNRPNQGRKLPVDANAIIEKTLALFRSYLSKKSIDVVCNLDRELPLITASPQQLAQCFMNIINNAVESIMALPEKDDSDRGEKGKIMIATKANNGNVVISIADSGTGIDAQDLGDIFQPFYTRRKKDGLGVGLSISSSIVSEHNGTITAQNQKGNGALFRIALPIGGQL